VPDQHPEEVVDQLRAAIAQATPRGIIASFDLMSASPPCLVDPGHPLIRKAAEAMTKVFGRETVYVRCGGSIPIVGLFAQALGIPSVMMGFGLPDDNIHAPNEKISISNYSRGIDSVMEYFERV
jgi:acetylornithine deacetylase/succinyl-diaminopimelate desuccinylase-like protein